MLAIELGRRGIGVVLVDLYGADFVLVRPDQIVAWRSNSDAGLEVIIRKLCGFFPSASDPADLSLKARSEGLPDSRARADSTPGSADPSGESIG